MAKTRDWNGSKWIRRDKRLAIYLRDGLACAYCGFSLEEGAKLTLDHVIPASHYLAMNENVNNDESNLVTCCEKCNKSRGDRDVELFATAVAEYVNANASQILTHVGNCIQRPLNDFRDMAKQLIELRGSYTNAMDALKEN